jgi:hypothetical protein
MMEEKIFEYEYADIEGGKRQYDDIDIRNACGVDARYVHVDGDKGNIFIEALPKPRMSEELRVVCYRPLMEYSTREKEIKKSVLDQILMITKLRTVRFQLPMQKELEEECYMALVNSYRMRKVFYDKDVFLPYTARNTEENSNLVLVGKNADAANAGFNLIGYSGCGKSSALEVLFRNYPQYIIHKGPGVTTFPQIVYLVVQCPPHSNFRGLYKNIGTALDRALGNLKPVYSKMLDAGERGNLSRFKDKVRELIEQFGIGLIVLDEIQNLSFNPETENSFGTFLELVNETKVAFGVVGTEEAKGRIYKSTLRQIRRLGTEIHADSYCDKRTFFDFFVKELLNYQWFDEDVRTDPQRVNEITDALFECTKGIIDQLIGLYIYMNVDYVRKKKKPVVNAAYVRETSDKHFPGVKAILEDMTKFENERQRAEIAENANKELDDTINEERQKAAEEEALNSLAENEGDRIGNLKKNIAQNILNVTDRYSLEKISDEIDKVLVSDEGRPLVLSGDERGLTRLTSKSLEQKTVRQPRTKKEKNPNAGKAIADYVFSNNGDDELLQ